MDERFQEIFSTFDKTLPVLLNSAARRPGNLRRTFECIETVFEGSLDLLATHHNTVALLEMLDPHLDPQVGRDLDILQDFSHLNTPDSRVPDETFDSLILATCRVVEHCYEVASSHGYTTNHPSVVTARHLLKHEHVKQASVNLHRHS